jgi:DNA-binding LacI/PurR family transcriptional regulator
VRNAVVDAIVTIGIGPEAEILDLIRKRRIPFVTIDGSVSEGVRNVGIDDEEASYALMRHLVDLGHRRIAVFSFRTEACRDGAGECRGSRTADLRLAGLERALKAEGLALRSLDVPVYSCGTSMEAASVVAAELLMEARRPTAILCLSDAAALGVYAACRRLSFSIPEELSVAGFDDIAFAAQLAPPLTTIRQPGFEKGRTAARLASELSRGRNGRDVVFPAELVVRGSTGPAFPD